MSRVATHISGSFVVFNIRHDEYIDARKDARHPSLVYLEYVRGGQVKRRFIATIDQAPAKIISWVKGEDL